MRIWGWALAGVLLAVGLIVFLGGDTWEIADQKAGVIAMIAGIGALVLALLQELRRHRTTRRPQPIDLDQIADQLAEVVTTQWRDEERIRRIHDPYAMPVHWTNAPDHSDHWANIRLDPDCDDPIELSGRLDEIDEVFDRIPSRRLVLLGKPGAGKTILTTRFVLSRLEERRTGEPVPVIVPLASWNPTDQGLLSWFADRLIDSYPELAALTESGGNVAARLLATKRILPVLDGFDEIHPESRGIALLEINRSLGAGDQLLLTSRPGEFSDGDITINGAAAVQLTDLGISDVDSYLRRSTRDGHRDKWEPLLTRLHDTDDQNAIILSELLSTPLMLALARAIYSDSAADPAELFDLIATGDSVETQLLSHFVPASYGIRDDDRVHRGLAFLAYRLRRHGTDDLTWWHLAQTVRYPCLTFGLSTGLAGGFVTGLMAGLEGGFVAALAATLVVGLTVGLTSGLLSGRVVLPEFRAGFRGTSRGATRALDPITALRRERRAALPMLTVALPYGLMASVVFGPGGLAVLLAAAILMGTFTVWGRFVLVHAALAAMGRIPWRFMDFLADAHKRGVLRQVGPVYQFRHVRLRDQLAAEYREKYVKRR